MKLKNVPFILRLHHNVSLEMSAIYTVVLASSNMVKSPAPSTMEAIYNGCTLSLLSPCPSVLIDCTSFSLEKGNCPADTAALSGRTVCGRSRMCREGFHGR